MVEHFTFDSGKKGTHIVFTGAVHGNEPCGPVAMEKIIQQIQNKELTLSTGKVTFIPICNPEAYAKDVRQIDANLNRICMKSESPSTYEAKIANELCALLESLKADVLLDIHSFRTQGNPFCFVDFHTPANENFAHALGCDYMITGWDDAFEDDQDSYGVVSFAHDIGLHSILVECGMNHSEESQQFAYQSIIKSLYYWGVIHQETIETDSKKSKRLHMDTVIFKEHEGHLTIPNNHFVFCKKDDVLAEYNAHPNFVMPYDGYIILPKADVPIGEEWFYIGKQT